MVRTKADGASRAVGAKAFRKSMSNPGGASSSSSSRSRKTKGGKYAGRNSYCPPANPHPGRKKFPGSSGACGSSSS
ncbi:hypothetical protein MRX96_036665 [Rhipicephalus microplus]